MSRNTTRRRKATKQRKPGLRVAALGVLCLLGSFAIGIQTAGDVQPIGSMKAEEYRLGGDMDGDMQLTKKDILRMLEIAAGFEEPTPQELLRDPNIDGRITIEDVIAILQSEDAS